MELSTWILNISEFQESVLKKFCEYQRLIKWIRNNIRTRNELAFLLEVAALTSPSAIHASRLKLLTDIIITYSGLIYDLEEDDGFDELTIVCEKVWAEVEKDLDVFEKLHQLNNHTNWLFNLEGTIQLVEDAVFQSVQDLNVFGSYEILYTKQSEQSETVSLVDKNRNLKTIELVDLTGVKETLILLIYNDPTDMDPFSEHFVFVLDSMYRISGLLRNLHEGGNILFMESRVNVFEEPLRGINMLLYLGSPYVLTGSKEIPLVQNIVGVTNGLKFCLEQWNHFLEDKRCRFESLNFFSSKQLLYLRKKLPELINSDSINLWNGELLNLLSLIKDCSLRDVQESFKKVYREYEALRKRKQRKSLNEQFSSRKISPIMREIKKQFVYLEAQQFGHTDETAKVLFEKFKDVKNFEKLTKKVIDNCKQEDRENEPKIPKTVSLDSKFVKFSGLRRLNKEQPIEKKKNAVLKALTSEKFNKL